ncbi:MAG: biopolymer transporter ExbD [Planctomycetota bacterium]|nr:MAG: biopolymer transporter ExbD [Planctomycetota bacterium]
MQAISSRKAGQTVLCAVCGRETLVVALDQAESVKHGGERPESRIPAAKSSDRPSLRAVAANPRRDDGGGRGTDAAALATRASEDDEPAFVTRKASTEFEEMDLTPMVDVTFLLLIFFMITASFSLQKTLPFPPPSPDEKGSQQTLQTLEDFEEDSVIVEIDENNVIYVEETPVTDPAALVDALRDAKKSELVLTAHPDALHETVVKVIDAANEVGMQKIRLAKLAALDF